MMPNTNAGHRQSLSQSHSLCLALSLSLSPKSLSKLFHKHSYVEYSQNGKWNPIEKSLFRNTLFISRTPLTPELRISPEISLWLGTSPWASELFLDRIVLHGPDRTTLEGFAPKPPDDPDSFASRKAGLLWSPLLCSFWLCIVLIRLRNMKANFGTRILAPEVVCWLRNPRKSNHHFGFLTILDLLAILGVFNAGNFLKTRIFLT